MKSIRILGAALLAIASINVAMAGAHTGGPAITGEGACTFVQENMFAGPFDVCQEPVVAESCAGLGDADDNANAVHSDGACATDKLVGTCDVGASKVHYLSGDADGLEIGCGFQGGDWIPAS